MAQICLYVPKEFKEKLEKHCKNEERSISYVVSKIISDKLKIDLGREKK